MLAVGITGALAYRVAGHSTLSELALYDGGIALALTAALWGWRLAERGERQFPRAVALSLTAFLVGELIWWWYGVQGQDPFPSVGDGVVLMAYIPLAFAAWSLSVRGQTERDRAIWLDSGVLTVAAGLVIWSVVMEPHVADPSESWIAKTVSLGYPLADLLVIGLVLRLILGGTTFSLQVALFSAGVATTLAADLVFAYQDLNDTSTPASFVDAAWVVGYVLIGTAALAPSRPHPSIPPAPAGRARLVGVLAALFAPLAVLLVELKQAHLVGLGTATFALAAVAVITVLVSSRLWDLHGRALRVEQRRSADRLAALIHHSTDAILLLDSEGRLTFASPAFSSLTGADTPDLTYGDSFPDWFLDDRDAVERRLVDLVGTRPGTVVQIEGRLRHLDGRGVHVEGTACNLLDDHSVGSIVVTIRDDTARRELEAQLERRAFHDELTGLPNRALFVDRLQHALDRTARREVRGVAVVFIDLDDFKAVNDGRGHSMGDSLLREVADRLRACFRPGDTVARLGGDEFSILLEDITTTEEAVQLTTRALEVLRLPLTIADLTIGVVASAGVAMATDQSTVETLLRDADTAMYGAKRERKGRAMLFDDSLRLIAQRRLELKIELPEALRDGQFRIEYQPIYDIAARRLRGLEALLRWDHPTRGPVPPLEFVPAAEETGYITEMGRWVLEQATTEAAAWNRASENPITVSVNVSAVQLNQPGFVESVRRALERVGLPGELLTLELTESVLVEHGTIDSVLTGLRAVGVGIAIDDFGTGFSSLSYLQRLPVTSVKIDRSFVSRFGDGNADSLVRTILTVAETLSLTTVAEGVETEEQLDRLAALDCSLAQGFLLGRPLRPDQVHELVARPAVPRLA